MQTFLEYVNGKSIEKKKVDRIGDYYIYTVKMPEIKKLGTHLSHPKTVPNKEVWISQDVLKTAHQFLIHNGVNQYEADCRNWRQYADKKEKAMREKVINQKVKRSNETPPDSIYDKYYCGIPCPNDDVEVWLVDGNKVRSHFKSNFFESGSGETFKWIPKQEIWIEKTAKKPDLLILHEYVEATLIRDKKMDYGKADVIAAKLCWAKRKTWDISKVKALDRKEALDLSRKYWG